MQNTVGLFFFYPKKLMILRKIYGKEKNMYLNEMQYIPSAPFFRHKDYQRIMWQNSNLISKMKENSLQELSSIIGRKKSKIIHNTVCYDFSVSVQCFEIEWKFSSVLKINCLSSYTTVTHTLQMLCIILKFKHQNLNWEGKLKLWHKHFSIKQNHQRADKIYQIKTIRISKCCVTN